MAAIANGNLDDRSLCARLSRLRFVMMRAEVGAYGVTDTVRTRLTAAVEERLPSIVTGGHAETRVARVLAWAGTWAAIHTYIEFWSQRAIKIRQLHQRLDFKVRRTTFDVTPVGAWYAAQQETRLVCCRRRTGYRDRYRAGFPPMASPFFDFEQRFDG